MAGKVEARRKALREELIKSANRRIGEDGLANLRARDLAKDAGCALGAIYNIFDDLDQLVLAVNALTFQKLGAAVAADLAEAPEDPTEQLVVMAQSYHHFAADNHNHWRALFDVNRNEGESAPDWYLHEMNRLFSYIHAPLGVLKPGLEAKDLDLLTRALFSSVHGIVSLGLADASGGVPRKDLDHMIALTLRQIGK